MKALTWSVSIASIITLSLPTSRLRLCMVQKFTDTEAHADQLSSSGPCNKANRI